MCMVLSLRWSMNAWPLLSVRNHLSRIWFDKDTSLSLYSAQLMPWSPVPEALKHPGHRNQSQPPRAPHAHCAQQQQGENRKSWAECRGGHGQPTRGQWSGHVVCSDQSGASIRRRLTRSRSYDELFLPLALCYLGPEYKDIWAREIDSHEHQAWLRSLGTLALGGGAVWVGSWVTPSRVTRVLWLFVTWHSPVTSFRDHDDDVISTHYGPSMASLEARVMRVMMRSYCRVSNHLSVDCGARISSQSQLSRGSRDSVTHISHLVTQSANHHPWIKLRLRSTQHQASARGRLGSRKENNYF